MSWLARWAWPQGIEAGLLPLPAGLRGVDAQRHWQHAADLAPCLPLLKDGVRIGWRSRQGGDLRLSYGHAAPGEAGVVLLAWRPSGAPALPWAVDCCADRPLAEGAELLRLYGAPPSEDFPRAWAELEARAKLVGGLREGAPPPAPAGLRSERVGDWVVALAWR